ncbi:MAG: DinB family protein [Phycisphaerales bacterium]
MSTATAVRSTSYIAPVLKMCLGYADALVKDVPPEQFAHSPMKNLNHAAFNLGHLTIYAERLLELVGRKDLARPDENLTNLFKAGQPCVDRDPRYPSKDELVGRFQERWGVVLEVLPTISDEVMARPNPAEGRMREMLPTIGAVVAFMCGSHLMMHLGQISSWRRVIGLGPVM